MSVCLNCGKEIEGCLCEECRQKVDIEELCEKVRCYIPNDIDNPDKNPIWEKVASEMEQPNNFKDLAFALADYLDSPRKEYQKVMAIVGNYCNVRRASKPWFYEVYDQIIENDGLDEEEKLRLKGLMLETLYQDYKYPEADELASELLEKSNLPWQAIYVVAEFFLQTRRYDEADDAISIGNNLNAGNDGVLRQFVELSEKNEKRRNAADTGKKEYLPNPKENKAEAIEKYTEFMATLGIDVAVPSTRFVPKSIPDEEYPNFVEKREADFDSFVAFDFETTGQNKKTDAIIEVGAIKVVNGQIVESAEFIFQEFVKPYKKSLKPEITELTGITQENLNGAREMWEVIPEFMKFVGDDIMVGYNSIQFDSLFLRRAGRYSHEIYTNKHFDVMKYAKNFGEKLGIDAKKISLALLSEKLGIDNPEAHRALSDAITTAKIYLKLKEMSGEVSNPVSTDTVLDLEAW